MGGHLYNCFLRL